MHLSVIIPAYNEEKRISATLRDIDGYLARQDYDSEIIVVNNASKDNTAGVVRGLQAGMPRLRLVDEHQKGKGHAVIRGMAEAVGEYRLFTDADNSTTIDHIERMWPQFRAGYDVVIASLAVKGSRVVAGGAEPGYRVLAGKLGNKLIQVLAVWGISDTQRGFKMFTARAALDIFPRLTIFGWGFDVEVLALARRFGYRIKEVPITWNNDPNGHITAGSYLEVLRDTFRIFWNLHTGVYNKRRENHGRI